VKNLPLLKNLFYGPFKIKSEQLRRQSCVTILMVFDNEAPSFLSLGLGIRKTVPMVIKTGFFSEDKLGHSLKYMYRVNREMGFPFYIIHLSVRYKITRIELICII